MQTTTGNGQQVPPQAGADTAQRLIVNAQYIKDLSFENPRAPQSLQQQQTAPAVDINVDVNAQPLGGETYEVVLTVNASAKINNDALFILELIYGAVVTAQNVPREMLPPVLLVETPRLMFPFARNIVAEATQNGGFPPLLINPIDFTELLRRNTAQTPPAANDPTSVA
ncbi:MAG TPA: protein-export chaperone SecB [Stellaceae bacterium]|nr:protein-export chaperone SecB [Stellaceae bacterium]